MTYAPRELDGKTYEDKHMVLQFPDPAPNGRYDLMAKDFYAYVKGTKENPFTYAHEYRTQKVLLEVISGK